MPLNRIFPTLNFLVVGIVCTILICPTATLGFTNHFAASPWRVSKKDVSTLVASQEFQKHHRRSVHVTRFCSQLKAIIPENGLASDEQIIQYASNIGIKLSLSTLGPGYRALARSSHDETLILGYCEGFIRPGGKIIHVDKLEVWKKALAKAKKENPDGFTNGGQVFGVSLLLGYLCLLHARQKGCTVAEFLAIDDEAFQHKRLVRFFKRAGFNMIKYVGDDLSSVPDRLVWGGCGTLMNQKVETLLQSWTEILSNSNDN